MLDMQPLGDQGVLAHFAEESAALRWAQGVRACRYPWAADVVQAYTTVAVFLTPDGPGVAEAVRLLEGITPDEGEALAGQLHHIPCCYGLELDLARLAEHTGLPRDEVIRRHAGREYTVYAIGFCPGFPYLGYLDEALCGVPRLPAPRARVDAGSIGLTGRQTGIYTEERPGGWNIVGRTPLILVDVVEGYFPLRTGDRVRFVPIDEEEFRQRQGQRLGGSLIRPATGL